MQLVLPDFNGDGIGDIAVGAPGASSGVGRAYIVYGNSSGIDEDVDLSTLEERDYAGLVLSGIAGGNFSYNIGFAVAAAGYAVYPDNEMKREAGLKLSLNGNLGCRPRRRPPYK